jgi:hypothetical protein
MSSDDELPPRLQRALRSKPSAPVTPIGSESDPYDAEEEEKKVDHSYARSRVQWDRMITINKGEMDDDERKEISAAGARAFMESSGLYKLPGHKSCETDCGLWKLVRDWWSDNGKTQVWVYKCPLFGRFGCKCQVKITENSNFHLLETRGVHNVDCHNPRKDKAKLQVILTGVRISISFL